MEAHACDRMHTLMYPPPPSQNQRAHVHLSVFVFVFFWASASFCICSQWAQRLQWQAATWPFWVSTVKFLNFSESLWWHHWCIFIQPIIRTSSLLQVWRREPWTRGHYYWAHHPDRVWGKQKDFRQTTESKQRSSVNHAAAIVIETRCTCSISQALHPRTPKRTVRTFLPAKKMPCGHGPSASEPSGAGWASSMHASFCGDSLARCITLTHIVKMGIVTLQWGTWIAWQKLIFNMAVMIWIMLPTQNIRSVCMFRSQTSV